MAIVALSLVMATSFGLLISGRRFLRRYVSTHGAAPPATWMFRRTDDPELERYRRFALTLLPVYLIAAVIFLLRPAG
jgi:hypothetical protein